MKSDLMKASILTVLSLGISCNTNSDVSDQSLNNTIPEYHLSVVDSFGVEAGDSINMIGSITGLCCHPSGAILLLDRIAMRVRVIQDGDSVFCFGREGEGPGEFLIPLGICAMEDGRILIADSWKHEVMEFDLSGHYSGSYINSGEASVPFEMYQVDTNSIVGSRLDLDLNSDPIRSFFYIGRFDAECDPSVKYEELSFELTSADIYRDIELIEFFGTPTGRVFIVPDNTVYSIKAFSSEGNLEYLIDPDIERTRKTEEEIQGEIEEFEQAIRNNQINPATQEFQPALYQRLIGIAGVDADSNLWVERYDFENGYHFDVWDPSGGIIYTVVMQNTTDNLNLSFYIDQYGILGANVDSDYYPRVYSYTLDN